MLFSQHIYRYSGHENKVCFLLSFCCAPKFICLDLRIRSLQMMLCVAARRLSVISRRSEKMKRMNDLIDEFIITLLQNIACISSGANTFLTVINVLCFHKKQLLNREVRVPLVGKDPIC